MSPERDPLIRRIAFTVAFGLAVVGVIVAFRFTNDEKDHSRAESRASTENSDGLAARIPGLSRYPVPSADHVGSDERVAYDVAPPVGGPHDRIWAACAGVAYDAAVRTEHMVHSLEHGAVWIAYDPQRVSGEGVQALREKVAGQNYLMISPYPGLGEAISVQSWGYQLRASAPADPRIDQFIQALRANPNTHPEVGATCDIPRDAFDPSAPPPFEAGPPGPGAVPMKGSS